MCLMVNHFGMCCMGHYPEYLEDNSSNLEKRNRVDNGLLLSDESSTESKNGSTDRRPTQNKAEDVCKRLTSMGFKLAFVFGNSPISADAKVSHVTC